MAHRDVNSTARKPLRLRFWNELEVEVDLADVAARSLSVKGCSFRNPLRFLEIYNDEVISSCRRPMTYEEARERFFPKIGGRPVDIGPLVDLPPFCWRDADVKKLCVSFTYNANAFYRIFKNISAEGKIEESSVENCVDAACRQLAEIYKAGDCYVIKNINNNFNMYLISRVVEEIVGRENYSCDCQELQLTRQSLEAVIALAPAYASYPVVEKMGIALGLGIAFIEHGIGSWEDGRKLLCQAETAAHGYFGHVIAIDDRARLLRMVEEHGPKGTPFVLCAVLDDASESVADLLWMQDLLQAFPYFNVDLLVNTAQVSINFSSEMLAEVMRSPAFRPLAARVGSQLHVTKIYCPFISFQLNFLPEHGRAAVDRADVVFVKGANFFETFQPRGRPRFYGFVVYGALSRAYSGLSDNEAVFAYVPAGTSGYIHHPIADGIVSLREIVGNRDAVTVTAT